MGLLIPVKTSISTDCASLKITDSTDYTVLGTARALLYLKLIVRLRKSTGPENLTIAAYNENTVTSWSAIAVAEDAWYEVYLFGCLVYSTLTNYASGWIVYSAATDLFYRSIQNNNLNNAVTNTTWWLPAGDDPATYSAAIAAPSSQPTTHEGTLNYIELCRSTICEGKMLIKAKCDCCDKCLLQQYEKVRMKIEGAGFNRDYGNFSEAQEIIENLNEICNDLIDCGCN